MFVTILGARQHRRASRNAGPSAGVLPAADAAHGPSPVFPPSPSAVDGAGRPTSLRDFALYALPPSETATGLAARRALMSRKGLSVEEVGARARERRRDAGKIQRFDRVARLLLVLMVVAGGVAWSGSARESIPALLAGYILLGLATTALIARLTRMPDALRLPLEHYYLPHEQLASADDIALLRRLAHEDRELEAATTAWWRSSAPIRKGDVALAVEFRAARRDGSGRQEA